jgi:hypothetical protein
MPPVDYTVVEVELPAGASRFTGEEQPRVAAPCQEDTDREMQRKSDQAEYGLGDRYDDDYPHDSPG